MLPRVAIAAHAEASSARTRCRPCSRASIWGYVGLIEGLVARIKDEYGKPMTVIATGGVASLFERADPRRSIISIPTSPSAACSKIYARNARERQA